MRKKDTFMWIMVCLFIPTNLHAQTPLGRGFTYQGHYEVGGVPVNGTAELYFSLWDAPTDGNRIGGVQQRPGVEIVDGTFNTIINEEEDFGPDAFVGEARWLEIWVCGTPGCASPEVLTPRQPLTPTPYAAWASSTPWSGLEGVPGGFADGVDDTGDSLWEANGRDILYTTGKVAIGSATPHHQLRVSGGPVWTTNGWTGSVELDNAAAIGWQSNAFGHRFGIGQSGGGLYFFHTSSDPGTANSPANYDMVITDFGQIGVGTLNPSARLEASAVSLTGVRGSSSNGYGMSGYSANSVGVHGESGGAASAGVVGTSPYIGVQGYGANHLGVRGESGGTASAGVHGQSPFIGVQGVATGSDSNRQGVRGDTGGSASGYAGYFFGNVGVSGTLTKGGGAFKIDHPLDPENKYLQHSFVESPDMMNVYNGNVVTDAEGYAEIVLPEYFEALNRDFRYQLTVLDDSDDGEFVWAKVVRKIQNNRFTIRASRPSLEVSWQVTGIRQDAFAKAHPIEVEVVKPKEERGKYLHPSSYGQSAEKGIDYRPKLYVSAEASGENSPPSLSEE